MSSGYAPFDENIFSAKINYLIFQTFQKTNLNVLTYKNRCFDFIVTYFEYV